MKRDAAGWRTDPALSMGKEGDSMGAGGDLAGIYGYYVLWPLLKLTIITIVIYYASITLTQVPLFLTIIGKVVVGCMVCFFSIAVVGLFVKGSVAGGLFALIILLIVSAMMGALSRVIDRESNSVVLEKLAKEQQVLFDSKKSIEA